MVSVIIPVYNREKELPDCFRSLENQTYRDYEVILVDDGSTDGTAALCQSQVAKDDRYRFFIPLLTKAFLLPEMRLWSTHPEI